MLLRTLLSTVLEEHSPIAAEGRDTEAQDLNVAY